MTNEKHLIIFNQGTKAWNDWRDNNPEQQPNLEETDLREKNLSSINLIGANLSKTNLSGQNLSKVNLTKTNLTKANLTKANLSGADLFMANLTDANLTDANLSGASLSVANLSGANLSGANLSLTEALNTNFSKSIFTAACLQDWHINNATNLNNVICDYIYLKANQQERRPHDLNKNFAPGDFTKLFQQVLETVDLIFSNGIDWRAVAYSIKNTQVLNEDTSLAIQSIENRGDGVVLIKVDVPQDADKGKIEGDFWQGYEFANKTLKEQYEARLLDKDEEINRLFFIVNQDKEVQKLMAEQPKSRIIHTKEYRENNLQNSRYIENRDNGTYYENINQNTDEIHTLIASLREIVQSFPEEQSEEAEIELNAIDAEIVEPKNQDPKKFFGRRLKRLVAAGTAAATFATGAAGFSGDINTFTDNVQELGEKLGVPIELIQSD